MRKLGSASMKWLKIFHIIFAALWFGGIISLAALRFGLKLSSFDQVNAVYESMRSIDNYLVRNGAQGILITSLVYSIWTNWGFLKHRWISVKWVVFVAQMVLGIVFLNRWVGDNIALINTEKSLALNNPIFMQNHISIQVGIMTQIILAVFLICISVLKPWKPR